MLRQKKAGTRYMYYVLSLACLLELTPPPPSLSVRLGQAFLSSVVIAAPTPLPSSPSLSLSPTLIGYDATPSRISNPDPNPSPTFPSSLNLIFQPRLNPKLLHLSEHNINLNDREQNEMMRRQLRGEAGELDELDDYDEMSVLKDRSL